VLLIAPEGIEMEEGNSLKRTGFVLLIAPEGIEIVVSKPLAYKGNSSLNRTRRN